MPAISLWPELTAEVDRQFLVNEFGDLPFFSLTFN